MKKIIGTFIFFCFFTMFTLSSNNLYGQNSCYDIGYRFGMCATKSLYGLKCEPENDIIIPIRCRGKEETNKGIKDGTKVVYDIIKTKSKDVSSDIIHTTSLETLKKRLIGKTPDEVKKIVGHPDRKQNVMGGYAWIYGNTYTEKDRAIVFQNGKVLTVTFY